MKFLIQIPQLIFGGAEKVLVSFANDLVSRGHDVEILETYEKGLIKAQFDARVMFNAICSKTYTKKYYASLADIREERNLLRKGILCVKKGFSHIVGYERFAKYLAKKHYRYAHYDVAINYLEIESPEFLRSAISADKYIQWYHIDVANMAHPEETDRLITEYEKMDAIICVAESARNNFVSRYPQLATKTHVIYNFFDTSAIVEKGNEPYSYDDNRFTMLSVGRMTEQKKYLRFLDVLARLKNDGYSFAWHILGTGAEYDAIMKKVETLCLTDCVFLDGVTDNPYKYMKNCDLFVLPSGWEGFPTVTVEAKILGCPVLATDVSGIREQLIHGETGWIVENNEDSLYEGLKYLFD
ncbi:MAG: glycosyltransferase, partial [Clostridia bacterium]|nr:glycosyltransferase [Clostridia bacterium]